VVDDLSQAPGQGHAGHLLALAGRHGAAPGV
jgi:hypothetical protein